MSSAIQVAKTATYLPDLVEVQRGSFKWFLDRGLIEELESFSPITDYTGKLELHFVGSEYRLKRPRHDVEEAKRRDATFASQMYVTCRLVNKETGEIKEQEVFIGELPLMTERGTFIINGAERVIVNQIVRSPGVYFKDEQDKNGRRTYNASLIPNRGAWLKFETDKNDLLQQVVFIGLKLQPSTTVGDQAGVVGAATVFVLLIFEIDTRATHDLVHDHALSAVDDERAPFGHQRQLADEDLLLFDFAGLFVDQAASDIHLRREGGVAALGLFHIVARTLQAVFTADKVKLKLAGVIGNRRKALQLLD